ncbi:hypothetical protein [Burkholderia pseudomallei]|uniref:hypothetical protein n=1 Tax=Burkholderia pseudomallei TaxID=28450 RepID=UPI0003A32DA8|nr:hypothetical protein [Burkholderia pseudomallei]
MPSICDSDCCSTVDAASYSFAGEAVFDVSDTTMIGESAGLTLRYVGLLFRLAGRSARAALIAACTSRAAPSMSRFRLNCSTIRALPTELIDVISATSAIEPRCRSSGLVTLVATVSGLAPGSDACTRIVGKSTCGSGETGSLTNANRPASAMPSASSVVATGRVMNGRARFIYASGCAAVPPERSKKPRTRRASASKPR